MQDGMKQREAVAMKLECGHPVVRLNTDRKAVTCQTCGKNLPIEETNVMTDIDKDSCAHPGLNAGEAGWCEHCKHVVVIPKKEAKGCQ